MAKVLLVEDDKTFAGILRDALEFEHLTVEVVFDGRDGLSLVKGNTYDLVILDWDLPGVPGVDILKVVRERSDTTPVIMLTAKKQMPDKEIGFGAGADDYISKPCNMREVVLRVQALLRRTAKQVSDELKVGALTLAPSKFTASVGGTGLALSKSEFALLEFLVRNKGQVFSAEALLERVWKDESDSSPSALKACVHRVRKKLGDAGMPDCIENLYGAGYRLNDSSAE